jgi:hypothetical protein
MQARKIRHRNHRHHGRSMLEKGRIFFQLISILFCVVKRGFVDLLNCSYEVPKLPSLGWRSANILQGIFPLDFLQSSPRYKISMERSRCGTNVPLIALHIFSFFF